jgi:deazaflavin-dependent oxidoreductase (nitroreductase family)
MAIQKPPSGSRGATMPPSLLMRVMTPIMIRVHKLTGNKMRGRGLIYLTTTGARSGQPHTNPVARFDDGKGGWYVVASFGGAASHPAWYHNAVAHPDQVYAEVDGTRHHVSVTQLEGPERATVWAEIVRLAPGFGDYETKTDRQIPILRLTPTG